MKVGGTSSEGPIIGIGDVVAAGEFADAVRTLEGDLGVTVEVLTFRRCHYEWSSGGSRFSFRRRKGMARTTHALALTDVDPA